MSYNVACVEAEADGSQSCNILPRQYTFEDACRAAKRLRDECDEPEVDYCVLPYGAWIGRPDLITIYLSEDALV